MDETNTPKILTPIRAIRAKCLDCMCDSAQEVRLCPITDCPLYPYRMGHNPNRKGMGGKFPTQVEENDVEITAESAYRDALEMLKSSLEMEEDT